MTSPMRHSQDPEPETSIPMPTPYATNEDGSLSVEEAAKAAAMIEYLKQKLVELETSNLRDQMALQRSTSNMERQRSELMAAKQNIEILQGNVETLKSLAVQLAVDLEAANLTCQTYKEKEAVAALKLERDVAFEITAAKTDYEKRAEELRRTLDEERACHDQERAMFERKIEELTNHHARVLQEKDSLIGSLGRQLEVAKRSVVEIKQQQRTSGGSASARKQQQHRQHHQHSGGGGGATDFGVVGTPSDQVAGNINILSMTLSVHKEDLEIARYIRGVGQLSGVSHSRFHVDIAADPSILEQLALPPGGPAFGASPLLSQQPQHMWGFMTPLGEKLVFTMNVEQ